ncbi:hypothetical protein BD560DRAFT_442938 [Blakeslea trispora]|nr:hypothetical protein BD560DRAFT_442938 [Blakeslea trispora]
MSPKRSPRNNSATNSQKKRYLCWQKVLDDYCAKAARPSLKEFVENNLTLVKENTPSKIRGRSLWINRFTRAIEAAEITDYLIDEPDWVACGFKNCNVQRRGSSSSLNYQACFDANELAKFEEMFHSLKDDFKWKLSTGKYVENVLYDFAKQCQYITPAHNLILDLQDAQITALFTKDELEEIKEKKPFNFDEKLSPEMSSCFNQLQGKRSFDELFEAIDSIAASPRTRPDIYWSVWSGAAS